eukprot:CAMPEP_0184483712 /NCGR_PEP_ID=MMETSP0113_2-20130426/5389_1 /TAXON_ID=91329 /ORGANISM="Norrisiella sphaerica, Strain BC52" /LENGTH=186 /DNA_ID=CAMNT_0026864275 /DNA_START=252 /DNA_END=812 /DNA_ORIENTATION=-
MRPMNRQLAYLQQMYIQQLALLQRQGKLALPGSNQVNVEVKRPAAKKKTTTKKRKATGQKKDSNAKKSKTRKSEAKGRNKSQKESKSSKTKQTKENTDTSSSSSQDVPTSAPANVATAKLEPLDALVESKPSDANAKTPVSSDLLSHNSNPGRDVWDEILRNESKYLNSDDLGTADEIELTASFLV